MPEENTNIGSVSQQRYEQIVAELRHVVEEQSQGQFLIGDRALEIEPMRELGGGHEPASGGELFTVRNSLFQLAEDISLAYRTVDVSPSWRGSPVEERRMVLTRIASYAGLAAPRE